LCNKMFVLLILLLVGCVSCDHKTSCPVGYTQTETYCYKYLAEAFNLFTADQACDVIDGKVVEVTSAHEQQLVEQYLSTQTNINNSHALVWLGATDLQVEGNYLYMSSHHQDAISSYNNWAPGHPAPDTTQNCAALSLQAKWQWVVVPCTYSLPVLCYLEIYPDVVG